MRWRRAGAVRVSGKADAYLGLCLTSLNKHIWAQVFKKGPSKICGRQPLKNLMGYGLLKAVFHKFYLVHSWILCLILAAFYFLKSSITDLWQHSKFTLRKDGARVSLSLFLISVSSRKIFHDLTDTLNLWV